jgi:hypothetical protein
MKRWANVLNRNFSNEAVQIGEKKHIEEILTIPGHKGNANQKYIKISFHSNQNGSHPEHKQKTTNVGEDTRKRNPLYTDGRKHYGKQYRGSSKKLNQNCHATQSYYS